MKIKYLIIFIIFLSFPFITKALVNNSSLTPLKVYTFIEEDCSECESLTNWLENQKEKNSRLEVITININENEQLYNEVKDTLNIKSKSIPLTIIGSIYFINYNSNISQMMKEVLTKYNEQDEFCNLVSTIIDKEDINSCLEQNKDISKQPNMTNTSIWQIILAIFFFIIIITIAIYIILKKSNIFKK